MTLDSQNWCMSFSRPQPAPVIELSLTEVETVMDRLADLADMALPQAVAGVWRENAVLRAQAATTERQYAVLINAYLREMTMKEKSWSL